MMDAIVCKGSYAFGSACGLCAKCIKAREDLGIPDGWKGKWPPGVEQTDRVAELRRWLDSHHGPAARDRETAALGRIAALESMLRERSPPNVGSGVSPPERPRDGEKPVRWEYLARAIRMDGQGIFTPECEATLRGQEGWELISAVMVWESMVYHLWFKRKSGGQPCTGS